MSKTTRQGRGASQRDTAMRRDATTGDPKGWGGEVPPALLLLLGVSPWIRFRRRASHSIPPSRDAPNAANSILEMGSNLGHQADGVRQKGDCHLLDDMGPVVDFVRGHLDNPRNATRKKAAGFVKRFGGQG